MKTLLTITACAASLLSLSVFANSVQSYSKIEKSVSMTAPLLIKKDPTLTLLEAKQIVFAALKKEAKTPSDSDAFPCCYHNGVNTWHGQMVPLSMPTATTAYAVCADVVCTQ
jgi:hypothetical protein